MKPMNQNAVKLWQLFCYGDALVIELKPAICSTKFFFNFFGFVETPGDTLWLCDILSWKRAPSFPMKFNRMAFLLSDVNEAFDLWPVQLRGITPFNNSS